jgi:hypothetical protein
MDFSTKPPRTRQFDEKIVDALHRLNGLFLKIPPLDHAIQTERNTICLLLADAAFEGRRCRRALDELVQNALRDEIEHQARIAAQKPTARILPFAPRTPCARPPSPGAA